MTSAASEPKVIHNLGLKLNLPQTLDFPMSKYLSRTSYDLAYDHTPGTDVCVIFCSGFNSTKQGNKARFLEQTCLENGWEYVRFDYSGHGESGGDFADCTVSTWIADTQAIIDEIAQNQKVVVVGSSMGGWIALHVALSRPSRVQGLILIACAVDMTKFYPERVQGLELKRDAKNRYFYKVPNSYDNEEDYFIYQALIDDGDKHLLLGSAIAIDIPVRLLHGELDDVVAWERSIAVLKKLDSEDVRFELIKGGDHRLSTDSDLVTLVRNLNELIG